MRYLPLIAAGRAAMLGVIGVIGAEGAEAAKAAPYFSPRRRLDETLAAPAPVPRWLAEGKPRRAAE